MTDTFTELLRKRGYDFEEVGGCITVTYSGCVYLPSLTTLPEGVTFKNGGGVYLGSLTTLPEGVTFKNGGGVNLGSLTGEHRYLGEVRNFANIDGYTMIITGSKQRAGVTIHTARYFKGGPVSEMPECYIAESGGITAHGDTIKSAIDDLNFKLADAADKEAVAEDVRASGKVTLAQFRAITGACHDGIRQHLKGHGVDLDSIDSMTLPDALAAMDGTSFGDTFKRFVAAETKHQG